MKRHVPIMAAALALAACGAPGADRNDHAAGNHHASTANGEPVFQLPVLPGRPGAAYFAIDVPADHGALLAVTSPQAGRIEMHETERQGSRTGMRMVGRIAPENGRIVLARGDSHLMLYEVNARLAVGSTAELVLRFEGGQTRTLEARVIAAADAHANH